MPPYRGLAVGRGVTELEMYSNIILNINYSHMNASYDEANHDLDYNLFGMINAGDCKEASHNVVANPQFVGIPMSDRKDVHKQSELSLEGFVPTANEASDTGTISGSVSTYDIRLEKRPQGDSSDRGPFKSSR